jgi:hypothetical protein
MANQSWSHQRHRLLVLDGTGLIVGNRVGVAPGQVPEGGRAGLFTAGTRTAGVRLVPVAGLPPALLAVSTEFAGRLGLAEATGDPWEVRAQPATVAASVTLEPITDESLDRMTQQLRRAGDLSGQVFWWDPAQGAATWIHTAGTPLRVRRVAGAEDSPVTGLVEVGPQTELTLFSQGNRTGVDIVVLADCSWSMRLEDVPDPDEVPGRRGLFGRLAPGRTIRRSEALRRALQRMADARTRVAGRVSRIALVRFGNECHPLFPMDGGMAEVGAETGAAAVHDLRRAIKQLVPQRDGTDIGNALHYASELLYRYGLPNNESLIVLVSDGAHVAPRTEERTGEAVPVYDDPVALMDELHQSGIRLHAIGISDEETFHAWWRRTSPGEEPHISSIPNHRLLGELVAVGGGDPTRIGGVDVLERYFGALGAGVSHRVGTPAPASLPAVQRELAEAVRRAATVDVAVRGEIEQRADRLRNLYTACHDACRRRGLPAVFQPPSRYNDLATLGTPTISRRDFLDWIQAVNKMFVERIHPSLVPSDRDAAKAGPYPLDGVRELIRAGEQPALDKLRWLRNDLSHDAHGSTPSSQERVGGIYAELTGLYALADDDAKSWARLQLGCCRLLIDLLTELSALLSRAPETVQPDDTAEETTVVGWTVTPGR